MIMKANNNKVNIFAHSILLFFKGGRVGAQNKLNVYSFLRRRNNMS